MFRILILNEKKYDGVAWYRYVQFASKAKELGLAEVEYVNPYLSEEELAKVMANADVYFARVNPSLIQVKEILNKYGSNKPLVVDMDDGFDEVDPLADIYRSLGVMEVQLEDKSFLWEDGKSGFDLKANKKRVKAFKDVISKVDAVTVTTFNLKNYVGQFNPVVAIIPNAINPIMFPEVKDPNKKEVRMVYAGGSSHYADLIGVKDALDTLMSDNPNLHFYFLGVPFKGITKDMSQDRVHTFGWVNADAHGFRLACIDGDIGICPLQVTGFNKLKSSVKFYEYSAVGMATVAKDIDPYKDDIQQGKSGLLYSDSNDFREKVQQLIDDPILRSTIANKASEYVKNHRSLDEITTDWVNFLKDIADAKKQ